MKKFLLPRLDKDPLLQEMLLKYCRLKNNEIWVDKLNGHIVGCLDVEDKIKIKNIIKEKATLAIHDPPYNLVTFTKRKLKDFINWSERWVNLTYEILSANSSFYVWLGADQKNNFAPFPQFIEMLGRTNFRSKSFITLRNQRGYGTSKNWMSVRQELLYYVKGKPKFNVNAVYTTIPKTVKGYYKIIGGKRTENIERSHSKFIRAGNVWIDIQQVFHLMEENVSGCFAQKPLKALLRIIESSSSRGDLVIDFFSHSGTTLLASEILQRKCFTIDINPIYCEISIRRLENYRANKKTGWQLSNPFKDEILNDNEIKNYLSNKYKITF